MSQLKKTGAQARADAPADQPQGRYARKYARTQAAQQRGHGPRKRRMRESKT